MATGGSSSSGFECSICFETLQDPRVLPCGHLFCGPPKRCLNPSEGVLKCAICSQTHSIQVSDLTPLYGLRDALQTMTHKPEASKVVPKQPPLQCQDHPDNLLNLWCEDCCQAVCEECVTETHDDHNLKLLKLALKKLAEGVLGKFILFSEKPDEFDKVIALHEYEVDYWGNVVKFHEECLSGLRGIKETSSVIAGHVETLEKLAAGNKVEVDPVLMTHILNMSRPIYLNDILCEEGQRCFYTYEFWNFNNLPNMSKPLRSGTFSIGGRHFWLECYVSKEEPDWWLSCFLYSKPIEPMTVVDVKMVFGVTLVNWGDKSESFENRTPCTLFSPDSDSWGCDKFMKWDDLIEAEGVWVKSNRVRFRIECDTFI